MTFSPFDKQINDLDEQELRKLIDKSIGEGWYIEYKLDIPKQGSNLDAAKIVKTIASFANTKGGWVFYGIDANDKNIATSIIGIDLSHYNNLPDQLSQIISSNIDPRPFFQFKIVTLANGNFVFVIHVEESPTPPYVTSQGIIYQRENNQNNPIKDRYIIEKLSEKTNDYYEAIERFCRMDYAETKGQSDSNQSYLELYLFPLPYHYFFFKNFSSTAFFNGVAARFYKNVDCHFELKDNKTASIPLNLGFNSIYSSQGSLIIRPLNSDNIIYKTTTAELFMNGGLKFLIPLNEFDINNVPKYYSASPVLEYLINSYSPFETVNEIDHIMPFRSGFKTKEVTRRKDTDFVRHIKMIDGAELIYMLIVIISIYKTIMDDNGFDLKTEIAYRARLTGTWRKFVFFDNLDYLEKIKLYNLPIAPKYEIEVPRFIKGNYYKMTLEDHISFLIVARKILDAIGLPDSASIQFMDIIRDGLNRFNTK